MYRSIYPTVIKASPDGEIVYRGPDEPGRWRRPEADALGRFVIDESDRTRPVGCVLAARRPGRLIQPGRLKGRIW